MKSVVVVGMAGAGYAATLHGNGYRRVSGIEVRLKTVVDLDIQKARRVAETYGFEMATDSFEEMLMDEEIDVIDIVTPPALHEEMIIRAFAAGKHVICEKPLSGYFGTPEDVKPIGIKVPKRKMYEAVLESMDRIEAALEKAPGRFLYAENYVYSTPLEKSAQLLRAKKSRILFAKGEESLKGSSSPVAGRWDMTGGGSMIRLGVHPLSGIIWLKQQEARALGRSIRVESVMADTGVVTANLDDYEKRHISAEPEDVEDIGTLTLTFTDGSKALIIASDLCLGGTKNEIELYCNDTNHVCHITPTDLLSTYYLDEEGMEELVLAEMLPSKLGWNKAFVSDEIIRGYTAQMQDFMESIAHDREPKSGFNLARETLKTIYAGYWSAEEGQRINL